MEANPEQLDAVAEFVEGLKARHSFTKAAAEPALAANPADAPPPLWANRESGWNSQTGQKASPALWIKMHYGNKDVSAWDAMGLARADIWAGDRPLYQALGAWLSRLKQKSEFSLPEGMEAFLESPTERLEVELATVNVGNPQDAYKIFPDDPKKAERIRSALRRRATP